MFKDLLGFFKEIIQNRTLLKQFSINDFKARYAGSALGIFWAFANPLVMVVTYWFVFGVGFKATMTDGKYPFYCFSIDWFSTMDVFFRGIRFSYKCFS